MRSDCRGCAECVATNPVSLFAFYLVKKLGLYAPLLRAVILFYVSWAKQSLFSLKIASGISSLSLIGKIIFRSYITATIPVSLFSFYFVKKLGFYVHRLIICATTFCFEKIVLEWIPTEAVKKRSFTHLSHRLCPHKPSSSVHFLPCEGTGFVYTANA